MTNFVFKKNLTETLKSMKPGESIRIKYRDFKVSAAHSAVRRLRERGFNFKLSERGTIDDYVVERLHDCESIEETKKGRNNKP